MDQIVSKPEARHRGRFRRAMALSRTAPPPTLAERLDRLARLRAIVTDNESRFAQAISADFGNRSTTETLVAETLFLLAEIKHASKSLERWMAAKHVPTELQYFPAKNRLLPQPLGVIGIIAPWNYPLQLTLAPRDRGDRRGTTHSHDQAERAGAELLGAVARWSREVRHTE